MKNDIPRICQARTFQVVFQRNGHIKKENFQTFAQANLFARSLRGGVLKGIIGVWQ